MHYLVILFCLMLQPLIAERLSFVEFTLPEAAKDWVVGNRLENEKMSTLIFVPPGKPRVKSGEFFGVTANKYHSDIHDVEAIKKSVALQFPNKKVDFIMVDRYEDSLLYEWKVTDKDKEIYHGWGRVFSNDVGTVLLTYLTEKSEDVENARKVWLPALRDAKVVQTLSEEPPSIQNSGESD